MDEDCNRTYIIFRQNPRWTPLDEKMCDVTAHLAAGAIPYMDQNPIFDKPSPFKKARAKVISKQK